MYWNEYGTKTQSNQTTNEYRYFIGSNFVGVNRLFELIYLNRNNDVNKFKAPRYYLPKGIIANYNVIINGEKVYDQSIACNIKKEVYNRSWRQLGRSLDYEYTKNHYRLVVVDLGKLKRIRC